jgi:hypothetical protein
MKERMASINPCRQALSDSKATRHPQFEQHRRPHGLSIVLRLRAQLHHATIINQIRISGKKSKVQKLGATREG